MKKGIEELGDIIFEGSDDLISDIIYDSPFWYEITVIGNDFDGI